MISDPARLQFLRKEIGALAVLVSAYRHGDAVAFDQQTEVFNNGISKLASTQLEKTRFPLEVLYERIEPLFIAMVMYWIALLLCFAYFLWPKRWLYSSGWIVTLITIVDCLSHFDYAPPSGHFAV